MAANTPAVQLYQPLIRKGHINDQIVSTARWVDNLVLVANTAQSYAVPSGIDPAGGAVTVSGPAGRTVKATIFRIVADGGPVWLDANGNTAAVPAANNLAGNGPVCIPAGVTYWLSEPVSGQALSFISEQPVKLSIEAWF